MVWVVLYCFLFIIYFVRLRIVGYSLVCPAFPQRCSDTQDLNPLFDTVSLHPNLRFFFSAELRWKDYRVQRILHSLSDSSALKIPRGIYKVVSVSMVVKDWSGFFSYRVPGGDQSSLIVYPGEEYPDRGLPVSSNQSPERQTFISFLKNHDFFESRPYYPGDDPRRIHWKMMARHNELFIREGTSLSPSRKSALFVMDAAPVSHRPFLRIHSSEQEGDYLLRIMTGLLNKMINEGLTVSFLFSPSDSCSDLDRLSSEARQKLLASVPPAALNLTGSAIRGGTGLLYYFTTTFPSSADLSLLEEKSRKAVKFIILPASEYRREQREGWSIVKA